VAEFRKSTHRQGQLKRIGELFISSILHHRPANESVMTFMEKFFHVDTRFIFQAVVTEPFEQPMGKRWTAGQRVFVRHDTTEPNLYEMVGIKDDQGTTRFSKLDWLYIRQFVKLTDKNKDGAEKVFGKA
jgi:hypothetical protein